MTNFWVTFRLLFRYIFRRDKTRGNGWKIALLVIPAIVGIMLMLGIIAAIAEFMPLLRQQNLQVETASYMLFLAMFVVFILGLVPTINYLYLSKDTEFFASLPIGASAVYMAKLLIVYTMQLLIATIILLPVIVTIGVVLHLGFVYFLFMLLLLISIPIVPLLAVSILSIPIMYMVSFFKRRGALTSIVLVLLFGGVYAGYFFLLDNSGVTSGDVPETQPGDVLTNFIRSVSGLVNALAPLTSLIRIAFADQNSIFGSFDNLVQSGAINFAIFAVFLGFCIVVTLILSSRIYMRGAVAQLEGRKTILKRNAKDGMRSPFWALVSKEYKEVLRTPAFAFQCLSMVFLAPVTTAFFSRSMNFGDQQEVTGMIGGLSDIVTIILMTLLGAGVNIGAATIMSREGDKFYFVKILPIDYKMQVRAKLFVHRVTSTIGIIFSLTVYVILTQMYFTAIAAFVFMFVYSTALVNFVALFDLSKPKLKWTTPNEVMKRNINIQVPTFLSLAVLIVLGVMAVSWYVIGIGIIQLNEILVEVIMWGILYFVVAILMILFSILLNKKMEKFINRIEV